MRERPVVALVVCVNQRAVLVDDGQLYRCGTNVNTQHKVGLRRVKWDVWCQLGTILYQHKLWTNHCFLSENRVASANRGASSGRLAVQIARCNKHEAGLQACHLLVALAHAAD